MAQSITRLDEAPRPGGLIYKELGVNTGKYVAVNAEGDVIPDAPPRPADTDPSKQPYGSPAAVAAVPIDSQALGRGIAEGLARASQTAPQSAPSTAEPSQAASAPSSGATTGTAASAPVAGESVPSSEPTVPPAT